MLKGGPFQTSLYVRIEGAVVTRGVWGHAPLGNFVIIGLKENICILGLNFQEKDSSFLQNVDFQPSGGGHPTPLTPPPRYGPEYDKECSTGLFIYLFTHPGTTNTGH